MQAQTAKTILEKNNSSTLTDYGPDFVDLKTRSLPESM